jgi:hypothetical protein
MTGLRLLLGLLLLGACRGPGGQARSQDGYGGGSSTARSDATDAASDGPARDTEARSPDVPAAAERAEGDAAEAGTTGDGPADTLASPYCPASCPKDGICVIVAFGTPRQSATCGPAPLFCRPEAGAPDGGAVCNQCIGFTLCQGAYGCLGTSPPSYYCGI